MHAKLTQSQLGERLGVSKGNVSAWENGHHEASVEQVNRIAEITGYVERLTVPASLPSSAGTEMWAQWPFPQVDQNKVRQLDKESAISLQAAILIAAAQVGLDIRK
ncbi:helix-turn-helix transcriptional regulator [Pusillimonas soli]|uniref:Helix-turn-helix transcriptional regulator n=2 Tax=Allopusillimonas soli TaxID=659016 RepID=A0A853F7S2_9BURK|nr:helix-turn-helix transcriptional regulator [Allopusillimonas soli]